MAPWDCPSGPGCLPSGRDELLLGFHLSVQGLVSEPRVVHLLHGSLTKGLMCSVAVMVGNGTRGSALPT